MKRKNFNPIALFGCLGLIGIIGMVTGDLLWFSWFAWFSWFGRYKNPTDERFFRNITKTGLSCFIVAVVGLSIVVILRGLDISPDVIFSVIGMLFAILLISFTIMFEIFERRGV